MRQTLALLVALLPAKILLFLALAANGGELTVSGSVSGEVRYFLQDPLPPALSARNIYPAFSFEPRLVYETNSGNDSFVVSPFVRLDNNNIGRSHIDLREAYWSHRGDGWSLTAGINKVYWGVAETNQLVDIINQDDGLEEVFGNEKLGQPMANLSVFSDWGTVDLFILPVFRELQFLTPGTRLTLPMPLNDAEFASDRGKSNIDFAVRWSNSIGDWDIAMSHFNGTSREPQFLLKPTSITPFYDQISQSGLEVQYTSSSWLWKLETIIRSSKGEQFWAAVGGFEWTISGIFSSGADLGLLLEYNYDGRDPMLAPISIYDDDLFLGTRLALNDIDDSSLLVGALLDRKTDAIAVFAEASRRFGDDWIIGIESGIFANAKFPDPIAFVNNDDFVTISLKRYF